ncbi:hypothetical protein AB0C24_13430 [Amycolatopsis japonica]|uniref:hypothetical protein n=1 Tax=Amycolatopsis japonica TaxID=208439 RepID=UPI003406FE99
MFQHTGARAHEAPDVVYFRQLLLLRDRCGDHVTDFPSCVLVVVLGDREQIPDMVQFLLRLRRRLEATSATGTPSSLAVGG